MGIPRFLQVDNELLFRGSNRRPRSFGPLICLCFYLGLEIRFIPEGERWRNGFVARLNDINEKLSWQLRQFRDLANVREELPRFEIFQNTQHRYAKLGSACLKVHTAVKRRPLSRRIALHRQELPWRERRVSFSRLIDEQGRVRFFSESLLVDPRLVHKYVQGKIFTKAELLKFTHQDRTVRAYPDVVTKPWYECSRRPATWD